MTFCQLNEMFDFTRGIPRDDYFSEERNLHLNANSSLGRTNDAQRPKRRKITSGNYISYLYDGTKQGGFPARDFKYSGKKCTENADENQEGPRRFQVLDGWSTTERHVRRRGRPFAYRKTPQALKFFLLILAMGSLPGIDPSVLSRTICKYLEYKERCENDLKEAEKSLNETKTYCYGAFDNYMCWPHVEPGQMAKAPCPDFYHNVNDSSTGYRYCQENGSWYQHWDEWSQKPAIWRHIEDCIFFDNAENDTDTSLDVDESEATLLTNLRTMYTIGYGISLVCLIAALLLLAFFKKLHCTRNYIHMNLMVSFILRYVVILVKDSVLLAHYKLDGLTDFTSNPDITSLRQYCDEDNSAGWVLTRCRLVITLMHYAISANYFWLLAEGLYLQMLLVFVMSENRYFAGFMVFGWGAPWVSVLIWGALRMHYENSGCWDMNEEMPIWWTIRAPIIISILINFFIFINIIRLIVSKLKAHHMARTDMKMRLAKSTLALIPLLGIHYIVFLALTEEVADTNATPMHLRLAFDMFLGSIQGTLVSVLYCFLNNEVRVEVKRAWNLWRSHVNLPRESSNFRKGSTTVSGNHSTQMTQFYSRHSATGGDLAPQETSAQSPNLTRLGADSRENSIVVRNTLSNVDVRPAMNGNGILTDAKSKKTYHDQLNEKITVTENNNVDVNNTITALITSVTNDSETNGNVDCRDDAAFLEEHV